MRLLCACALVSATITMASAQSGKQIFTTGGNATLPFSPAVKAGDFIYVAGTLGTNANFDRLHSSTMNVQLGTGGRYTLSTPQATLGAIYQGLVVGVSGPRGVIRPLRATWPDRTGRFSLLLPSSAQGATLTFWENQHQFFSRRAARPGGPVELATWPKALGQSVPRGLATVRVARR